MAVAAAWIAQSFFEWTWDIPGVTLPMFVGLGVLAARPRAGAPGVIRARGPATAAVAVAFVLVALSALLPAIARVESNGALRTRRRAGRHRGRTRGRRRAGGSRGATEPTRRAATDRRGDDRRRAASVPEEARDYLLRAVRRQPYDAQAWLQLTAVAFETGDDVTLRRAADEALRLDPRGDRTRGLAVRAARSATGPAESATATGAPLPTQVPGV